MPCWCWYLLPLLHPLLPLQHLLVRHVLLLLLRYLRHLLVRRNRC